MLGRLVTAKLAVKSLESISIEMLHAPRCRLSKFGPIEGFGAIRTTDEERLVQSLRTREFRFRLQQKRTLYRTQLSIVTVIQAVFPARRYELEAYQDFSPIPERNPDRMAILSVVELAHGKCWTQ